MKIKTSIPELKTHSTHASEHKTEHIKKQYYNF